jgi:hypothetical protein
MSSHFKKAAFKALFPALMVAPPGFASVRSASVSRQLFTRAVVVASQSEHPETLDQKRQTQANPFAAFGHHDAVE